MRIPLPDLPRLAPDETMDLFRRWRAGGEDHRQAIIEGNLAIVFHCMRRFRKSFDPPREDLFGDGMAALIEAVDRFDLDRGVRFSTYAHRWIENALRECRRGHQPIGIEVEDWGEVPQAEGSGEPGSGRARRRVEEVLSRLDPIDAAIIVMRYGLRGGEPMTLKAIGRKLAMNPGVVCQRVATIEASLQAA